MAFFAVGIPQFAKDDVARIEAHRLSHDPQAKARIPLHFSLVYGIECAREFFVREVEKQAENIAPIAFELRVATLRLDARSGEYLEHLVPEKGFAALVKLHDQLYSDAFTPHQRLDLGYIPEMTIGRCQRPVQGKVRIAQWNATDFVIPGRLDRIDIFMDGHIPSKHVHSVKLGDSKPPVAHLS